MADKLASIDFVWQGKDQAGNQANGEIKAKNEIIARANLRKSGVRELQLKRKPKPLFTAKAQAISAGDVAIFTRQLATMLNAGIPLVQSFDIIGKGFDNPSMAKLLLSIKLAIEAGGTLSEALRQHPRYFNQLFCSLVEAGEQSGTLGSLLDKIASYKEKSEAIKRKVKKALIYPLVILAVAFIVTAILLLFVVPVFADIFSSFGADLPVFTQFVMRLSAWIQVWWWAVVGGIYGSIKAYRVAHRRSEKLRHYSDRFLLKIPVIGLIVSKSAIARFSRTLATMSAAGVPLVDALEATAGACGNSVYHDAVLQVRDNVATGQRLQLAMAQFGLFPHRLVQMIAIGEESGSLDKMLDKVADFYEQEVDSLVDNLSSLIEPFIMIILGIVVGGLVVAMYLPIFKLGATM